MPDQDLLPRGHTMMRAPAPPAGLGDVLTRAGRRRRRQQAGVLATGAAACAAVLAFTMASGGAVDSLRETPATQTGQDVVPLQTPRVSGPDAAVPAGVDGAGSVAGSAPQGTGAQRAAAQTRQDKAQAAVAERQQASDGEVGPPHTTTAYDPSRGCGGPGPTAVKGWCGYYDGALSGRSGHRVELAQTLCRLPGQGAGSLTVDTGQQAEFNVYTKDNYDVWDWASGRRFSKQGTTFTVAAGTCLRWAVTWNVVSNSGRPVAAGAYELNARPTAYPSGASDTYVWADAQIMTFTVTG